MLRKNKKPMQSQLQLIPAVKKCHNAGSAGAHKLSLIIRLLVAAIALAQSALFT